MEEGATLPRAPFSLVTQPACSHVAALARAGSVGLEARLGAFLAPWSNTNHHTFLCTNLKSTLFSSQQKEARVQQWLYLLQTGV